MDTNNREFLILAMHLRDRASKNQHQPKAKKHFAGHFCFYVPLIPFTVLGFVTLIVAAFAEAMACQREVISGLSGVYCPKSEVTQKLGDFTEGIEYQKELYQGS